MIVKLTDKKGRTRGGTQWGTGITHEAEKPGVGLLCGPGWIHAYEHPLLAVLHDPIHGEFGEDVQMWECETTDASPLRDGMMKIGFRRLTTIRRIEKPDVHMTQRVAYAILCVKEVCNDERWNAWADAWLNDVDRTAVEAVLAAEAVLPWAVCAEKAMAWAAMWAAEAAEHAVWAARAARAAEQAARAAEIMAAWAVCAAAEATARAARAAAGAAEATAMRSGIKGLDLVKIAEKAMAYK